MDFTTAQTEVVQAVVQDAAATGWEHLFVDAEIHEESDGFSLSTVNIAIARPGGGEPQAAQFSLGAPAQDAIIALYRNRKDEAGALIGGFELTVEHTGQYRFNFTYDEPKRAKGIWDPEKAKRIDGYLERYKAAAH